MHRTSGIVLFFGVMLASQAPLRAEHKEVAVSPNRAVLQYTQLEKLIQAPWSSEIKILQSHRYFSNLEEPEEFKPKMIGASDWKTFQLSLKEIENYTKKLAKNCQEGPASVRHFLLYLQDFLKRIGESWNEDKKEFNIRERDIDTFIQGATAFLDLRSAKYNFDSVKFKGQDEKFKAALQKLRIFSGYGAGFVSATFRSPMKEALSALRNSDDLLCLADAVVPDGTPPHLDFSKVQFSRETESGWFQLEVPVTETGAGLNSYSDPVVPILENVAGQRLACRRVDIDAFNSKVIAECNSHWAPGPGPYFFKGFKNLSDYAGNKSPLSETEKVEVPTKNLQIDATPPRVSWTLKEPTGTTKPLKLEVDQKIVLEIKGVDAESQIERIEASMQYIRGTQVYYTICSENKTGPSEELSLTYECTLSNPGTYSLNWKATNEAGIVADSAKDGSESFMAQVGDEAPSEPEAEPNNQNTWEWKVPTTLEEKQQTRKVEAGKILAIGWKIGMSGFNFNQGQLNLVFEDENGHQTRAQPYRESDGSVAVNFQTNPFLPPGRYTLNRVEDGRMEKDSKAFSVPAPPAGAFYIDITPVVSGAPR